jgi:hypothetical protein
MGPPYGIATVADPPGFKEIPVETRITRACQTLKTVFLAYREATWSRFCKQIMGPQKTGVAACIVDDPTKAGRRNGWFCDFPGHLVIDPILKQAVLSTMACHDIAFMKKLIEQMFEGTFSRLLSEANADHGHTGLEVDIEEVKARIKPHGFRTVVMYDKNHTDFNDYDFWLMRVTSRTTGLQIAFDVTGAQYGQNYVAVPWKNHMNAYVEEILAVKPFGTLAEFAAQVAKTKGLTGMAYDISASAMQAWHKAVDPAMAKKGLTWVAMFKKPAVDYTRHSEKVLRVGKKAIETWVADQRLTKRRLKAERYDERHEEEILDIFDELSVKYLEANRDVEMERSLTFPKILK